MRGRSRIAIVGNAGSGKSYLAQALSIAWNIPVIDLDEIFWMPGGYSEKRARVEVYSMIDTRKRSMTWIVEGVYGDLVEAFLDRTELLIWLDLEWELCRTSLLQRASTAGRTSSVGEHQMVEEFQELLNYAEQYQSRKNSISHAGHKIIYEGFPGAKLCFTSRDEVNTFIEAAVEEASRNRSQEDLPK